MSSIYPKLPGPPPTPPARRKSAPFPESSGLPPDALYNLSRSPLKPAPVHPRAASMPVGIPRDNKTVFEKIHANIENSDKPGSDTLILPGLKKTLFRYQVDGLRKIGEQEEDEGIRGGILADEQGLGKTPQIISRILQSRGQSSDHTGADATLILCPLTMTSQWKTECEKFAPCLRVLIHHGTSRTKTASVLLKYDVVISTYETNTSELKDKQSKSDRHALHDVYWKRVVLDEAHIIRNRNAEKSKAAYELQAWFRWTLTGTPIQNDVEDVYSLVKFLRIEPWTNFDVFKARVIDKVTKKGEIPKRVMQQVHLMLAHIMIRRTKDTVVDGKVILTLPSKTVTVVTCEMDDDERAVYTAVSDRIAIAYNKYIKTNASREKISKYMYVLALLTRLRQACNHPKLLIKDLKEEEETISECSSATSEERADSEDETVSRPPLESTRATRTSRSQGSAESTSFSKTSTGSKEEFVASDDDFTYSDSDGNYSDATSESTVDDYSDSDGELAIAVSKVAVSRKKGYTICISCGKQFAEKFSNNADACLECELHLDDLLNGRQLGAVHLSSAKIRKVVELLADIRKRRVLEGEMKEKTIVFSQWTSFLNLLEPFLVDAHYKFVRIDGTMKPQQRADALKAIQSKDDISVILISLMAGGSGLNLTSCNNVILTDLWWNPFVEEQAFDRAHRVGQTRQVNIYKLCVERTIEERIIVLQDRKRQIAAAALSGHKVMKKAKLTVKDLMLLFNGEGV